MSFHVFPLRPYIFKMPVCGLFRSRTRMSISNEGEFIASRWEVSTASTPCRWKRKPRNDRRLLTPIGISSHRYILVAFRPKILASRKARALDGLVGGGRLCWPVRRVMERGWKGG